MPVPFPPAYGARRWAAPASIDRIGEPATSTGSLNATVMLNASPARYVPLPAVDETASMRGARVSIRTSDEFDSEPRERGSGSVLFAALPISSYIPPPKGTSAEVPAYSRSADESPGRTVYSNTSVSPADPEAYLALPGSPPVSRYSRGAPSTRTFSSNLTAISTVLPAPYAPSPPCAYTRTTAGLFASSPTPEDPPSESGDPAVGRVMLARFPAASAAIPRSASVPAYSRVAALSPVLTRYEKLSTAVPAPPAYRASLTAPLRLSASDGVRAGSGIDTGSSKCTDTRRGPAPRTPPPSGAGEVTLSTRGASVSIEARGGDPPSESGDEGSGRAVCASLPASSRSIAPPGSDRAFVPLYRRLAALSPSRTV